MAAATAIGTYAPTPAPKSNTLRATSLKQRTLFNQAMSARETSDLEGALKLFRAAYARAETPITGLELRSRLRRRRQAGRGAGSPALGGAYPRSWRRPAKSAAARKRAASSPRSSAPASRASALTITRGTAGWGRGDRQRLRRAGRGSRGAAPRESGIAYGSRDFDERRQRNVTMKPPGPGRDPRRRAQTRSRGWSVDGSAATDCRPGACVAGGHEAARVRGLRHSGGGDRGRNHNRSDVSLEGLKR